MKTIAAITFHHAHNFGSALQTYALQEYVKSLYAEAGEDVEYKIINYYTELQERLYDVYKPINSIQALVKNVLTLPYAAQLNIKHRKFEEFLEKNVCMTRRYRTLKELRNDPPKADIYISGSDQIWNVRAKDFSTAYYFDFLGNKEKRISYAASLGPLRIDWNKYDGAMCAQLLDKYSAISVREQGSVDNISELVKREPQIHVDPTLLLTKEQWRKVQSKAIYQDGKYILLYCLETTKEQLAIANAISKKLGLPIVVLRYNNKNDMFNHYVKKYDAGPEDFLAYIDHASMVLSSSFHGTVFSIIYHKPVYSLGGMKDNRISSILKKTSMTDRSIETWSDVERVNLSLPDGDKIDKVLAAERRLSEKYLREALGIE